MKHFKHYLIALLLLSGYQTALATSLKLCIDSHCKNPQQMSISEATWTQVKDLYNASNATDIEEQENLSISLKLIENDIYQSIATANPELPDAESAYSYTGLKNTYKNIRQIIGLLMDQHLVSRHLLRTTLVEKNWYGLNQLSGLMIQSRENAQLYVISKNDTELNAAFTITPYDRQP